MKKIKYFLVVFFIFNATVTAFSIYEKKFGKVSSGNSSCEFISDDEMPEILGTWNITAEDGLSLIFYKGMDDDWGETGEKKYFVWMFIEDDNGGQITNREIKFCKAPPSTYVYLVKDEAYFKYYRKGDALFLSQIENEPLRHKAFDFVEFTVGSVEFDGFRVPSKVQ